MRVYMQPGLTYSQDSGMGQVVHALHHHLPRLGVDLVERPDDADIIALHYAYRHPLPRVDVLHVHSLRWTDDLVGAWTRADDVYNHTLAQHARAAQCITTPTRWVGEPFRRDMRIDPLVIPNGITLAQWRPGTPQGYALWNKNRTLTVCDPTPAWELARAGVPVRTTFAPPDRPALETLTVTGAMPHADMRREIQSADVYLATTLETFGIGALEAMACGVPVLGYAWGGTAELVRHRETGYLVEPGDHHGLSEGYHWLMAHRDTVSEACLRAVHPYDWSLVAQHYVTLYERIIWQRERETHGVAVVIPCHNYGHYLGDAIESVLAQTEVADEVVVVDDSSSDDTPDVAARYADRGVRYIRGTWRHAGAARNAGVAATQAPYLICLDADDTLAPATIATLLPAMAANRALGVVYGGLRTVDETGAHKSVWPPTPFVWEQQIARHDPPSNLIAGASALFRRTMWERCGGYTANYLRAEDVEFWDRGLACGFEAQQVTTTPLLNYRQHPNSKSRQRRATSIAHWLPWLAGGAMPFAAPTSAPVPVRSYHMPAVSVIVPVGPGHDRLLPRAIESLLGQTLDAWEAVVVDDTRTGIDARLLRPYPFARVVCTIGSEGAGAARNAGLDAARAPLCVFLDADDYLMPTALQEMVAAYADAGGRYIYPDWAAWDGERLTTHTSQDYVPETWLHHAQHGVTALLATDDARRVRFRNDLTTWEDWDFYVRCAVQGVHGQRLARPLLGYDATTGTRRADALRRAPELRAWFRAEYNDYHTGERIIMGCCGGNTQASRAAQQHATRSAGAHHTDNAGVRMEFTGAQSGAVTFHGRASKQQYRGGNNAVDRFATVHPNDVPGLEATGKWRRVQRAAQGIRQGEPLPPPRPVIPEPVAAPEPEPDPVAVAAASSDDDTSPDADTIPASTGADEPDAPTDTPDEPQPRRRTRRKRGS